MERDARIDQSPAIAHIADRLRAQRFAAELEKPSHRYHRAWRELRTPAVDGSRRGWFVSRRKVFGLLTEIRQSYPAAEDWLDWYRVGL